LTFFLGVILYAVYDCITEHSLQILWTNTETILQEGISSGCFSAVFGAFIDNLLGKSNLTGTQAVIRKLIEGFIDDNELDEVAEVIAENVSAEYSEEDVVKVKQILSEYKEEKENRSAETEAELLARLIVETLKRTA
jgi:hydroxyethylthiazole kinase-like sugar kinase family protein